VPSCRVAGAVIVGDGWLAPVVIVVEPEGVCAKAAPPQSESARHAEKIGRMFVVLVIVSEM
jgi:hypothetical protein